MRFRILSRLFFALYRSSAMYRMYKWPKGSDPVAAGVIFED
ncbi:uncharacterized protein METZ01_LOCUS419559 [marine metagenome]|uniref:Uncharacterized protein n=1 Tax=marine metagenome TaxID=408172 RepID=A0A382X7Y5_9ZZZZ